jgi:hypothetical protein
VAYHLVGLLDGLKAGRAEYQGDDRDWLLGLASTVRSSIATRNWKAR